MEVKEDESSMDPLNTDTALVLGNAVFDPSKDNNVKALINPKMYKTLIKPRVAPYVFVDKIVESFSAQASSAERIKFRILSHLW